MRKSTFRFIAVYGLVSALTAFPTHVIKAQETIVANDKVSLSKTGIKSETDLKRDLVAWYPFSGNSTDESGNGHHATHIGATLTSDRHGKENKAYLFNGKNNTVSFLGTKIKRPIGTISFWTKTDQKSIKVLTLQGLPGKTVISVRKVNHKFELEVKTNNQKVFLKDKVILSDPNAFNFVAIVSDGSNIHFMVNNRKVGSLTLNKKLLQSYFPYTLNKDLIFCSKVVLDDIYIFSRALNRQELKTLFTESLTPPEVSYETQIKIGLTSAEIYRFILSDGGAAITSMGVCWNTTGNPDTSDHRTTTMPGQVGLYKSSMTDLLPGTKYYVKAYAINSHGIGYSDEVFEFSTPPNLNYGSLTDIDGNQYRTVKIGTQTWMAENLKTTRYADGTPIIDGTLTPDDPGMFYYVFLGDTLHREIYGLLYTWEGATNSNPGAVHLTGTQGVCPDGWHIPSYSEKEALLNHLGGTTIAGDKLKEVGGSHWDYENNSTNETGFSALGSGVKTMEEGLYGVFVDYRTLTYFWTSESYSNNLPQNPNYFAPVLQVDGSDSHYWSPSIHYGAPVRCIKDNTMSYVTIPEIETLQVTGIRSNSATGNGSVKSDGGQFRTVRGLCWSKNPSPDTSDYKTSVLDDRKAFTANITGLKSNTRYYVRAYGITSAGISYGNEVSFVTKKASSANMDEINSTQQPSAEENMVEKPDFDFYPNPAGSVIQFRNLTENVRVIVYDAKGKTLINESVITNMLDISSLPDGVYYMKISDDRNSVIKKLIKQ
jgi:uncharacterized protein (TIGR02145 family)